MAAQNVDPSIMIETNLALTQALINKLLEKDVLSKEDVAQMLRDIVSMLQTSNHGNAVGIVGLLRTMFIHSE